MTRKFIATFVLPKPTYEHANIKARIDEWSNGDFKQLVLGGPVVQYLFTSNKSTVDMNFDQCLLNGDSFFLVEIADTFTHRDLHAAGDWLFRHLPDRR